MSGVAKVASPRTILLVTGCGLVIAMGFALVFGSGIVAAIAIPNFVAMQLKAKRAEVPSNVQGILTAELAYYAAYGTYVEVGDEASARAAVGREQRAWEGGSDFDALGWIPDGKVRGGYWAVVRDGEIQVHGVSDVDGDGAPAEYVATPARPARMVSPSDAY